VTEAVTALLLLVGAAFAMLGALGLLRMPDVLTRMQPATKTTTLGVGCMLMGVAVHFDDLGIASRALAAGVFVVLTAPVAAHMIARAAYFVGHPLWEGTIVDELRGRYDPRTHALDSPPAARPVRPPQPE
jgi:multicomponent Na+:H+ antiporter subunit G